MSNIDINEPRLKKVFIAFPYGLVPDDEEIRLVQRMKRSVEAFEGTQLELITVKIGYDEMKRMGDSNNDIFKLGLKIEALSKADVFVGFSGMWDMPELSILNSVASDYGIKKYLIDVRWLGEEFYNAVENYRNRSYPVCDDIPKRLGDAESNDK